MNFKKFTDNQGSRKYVGMTLVELLGVMAVLAILAAVGIGGIMSAQTRARETSVATALSAYEDAFVSVFATSPGVAKDRSNNWIDEATYTSEEALKRLIHHMNQALDDQLDLRWDSSLKCYTSYGTDPWGGNYVLTEYPILADGTSYFDASAAGNEARMCVAVWATGNNDAVKQTKTIMEDCYGVGLMFVDGTATALYQGLNDEYNFTDATVKMQ